MEEDSDGAGGEEEEYLRDDDVRKEGRKEKQGQKNAYVLQRIHMA